MDSAKQRQNAKKFISEWKGYEKGETQKFWISLLQDVLGIPQATRLLDFERQVVVDGQTKFIDAYIKPTKILIEQKGASVDLNRKYKQSGGAMLTPFEQAKRYAADLGKNFYPNYIVVCNFREFHIHDMSDTSSEPEIIKLEELPKQIHRLAFLADVEKELTAFEQEVSVEAGEIVGEIYDALLAQYANKESTNSLKSLNKLCVRLVFCLYAEDSGLFSTHLEFHNYLRKYSTDPRNALIQLFKVLNTPEDRRDPYLPDDLLAFPYVNGGLFADEDVEIPRISPEIVELILKKASEGFDWSLISPTIFGAVFESTLNPETRRKGGMHYTSVENIHKVIDPLFLSDLRTELKAALELKATATRNKRLEEFRAKIGKLTFLDPACGSGNFLTETYTSLRKMENEALRALNQGQISLGESLSPIQVHISQFYGIEINDFAVTVARTALWIAESQMMKETEDIVGQSLNFLPLKSAAHIHEGNALRIDWNEVVPASKLNYIMGNPPFFGARLMTKAQKEDVENVFGKDWKNSGNLDYVSCWFKKCADFMQGTSISAALVATNSISQGDSVATLWKPLLGTKIFFDFAYRTFRWDSESLGMAHVHCVIIGFKAIPSGLKNWIFDGSKKSNAKNINGYLIDGANTFIESRNSPLCDIPCIGIGNKPIDGGVYLFSKEEMENFISQEPASKKFFRPWYGSKEFIEQKPRYCLYLRDCDPKELRKMPLCLDRIEKVRDYRLKSPNPGTVKLAETPTKFHVTNIPKSSYLIIPKVSSEKREYVPIGFMKPSSLASDLVFIVSDATLYHFGILNSSVHMAWMRTVAGRLKSDYRYSKDIVYNNFPWPEISDKQKKKIEETAKGILTARSAHSDCSYADLYNSLTMPEDLLKAHITNDKAVMKAYGFKASISEAEIVAELFKRYEAKLEELAAAEEVEKAEKKKQASAARSTKKSTRKEE